MKVDIFEKKSVYLGKLVVHYPYLHGRSLIIHDH